MNNYHSLFAYNCMSGKRSMWNVSALLPIFILLLFGSPARALPMFARKYKLACATCHTMPPRLTRYGYEFYRAGYRLPGNEVKPYDASHMLSFLGQFTGQSSHPGGSDGFSVDGVEIDLATSIEKNFALRGVYTFSTTAETGSGFDELWLQYNSAPSKSYWSVRAGQLPVLSGYQLMGNRQITLTDPMLFGANGPLTGDTVGNFSTSGLERGIEVGYTAGAFHTRLSWLNGVDETGEGAVSLTGHRGNDFVLQGDYFLDRQGSAVGAFYYNGKTPITSLGFNDNLQRAGVFATLQRVLKKGEGRVPNLLLELNGGLQWGQDTLDANSTHDSSFGSLLETALYLRHQTALALRYDSARGSNAEGAPTSEAYTFALTHRPNNFLRFGLEYRTQRQPRSDSVIGQVWFFY